MKQSFDDSAGGDSGLSPEDFEYIRDRLIEAARQSVIKNEKFRHKRLGCLEGLMLCERLSSLKAFVEALEARKAFEAGLIEAKETGDIYSFHRRATDQIAFIHGRLRGYSLNPRTARIFLANRKMAAKLTKGL